MATGQAKTKAEELMFAIMALGESRSAPSLDIARLKQQAQMLRSSDLYGASLALGMLAALEFDESEMRKNHDLAQKLRPEHFYTHRNFAASLVRLNHYAEARASAIRAYEVAPSSVDAIDYAMGLCVATGHFADAVQLLEARNKLGPTEPCVYEDIVRLGDTYLKLHGVSVGEIETLQSICLSVLRESAVHASWIEPRLMADEESEWLSFHFIVYEPVERVVSLSVELAERLASIEPPMEVEDHITMMYMVGT
jgi:hypothetical protein